MKLIFPKPLFLLMVSAVLVAVGIALAIPQPAEAQCGSSASSCQSCHETQGEYPVNTEGEWHTDHSFGDFCEFCHAGNVQAKEQEAAHQGLADPLSDVNASCQSCHPDNFMDRGQAYASTLGVELGTGSSGGGGGDAASGGSSGGGMAAPLGGEEIDYNLLYAEKTAPPGLVENWGNLLLGLMLFGLAGAFFVTAWSWEGWGPKAADWIDDNVKVVSDAVVEANASVSDDQAVPSPLEMKVLFERKPALKELWPRLADSDQALLRDLAQILNQSEQSAALLHAISRLDLKLATTMKQLDDEDRDLLLALVKEME